VSVSLCGCTSNEERTGLRGCSNPIEKYAGAVLATGERNGYDDSDFYAVVWDAAEGRVRTVVYGSTSYWSYHNGARVDATCGVRAAAAAWALPRMVAAAVASAEAYAQRPRTGDRVRSTTSKGKNVGVEGTVFWTGEGYSRGSLRVGVRVEGESDPRWLDGRRVEVVDAPAVDVDGVRARLAELGDDLDWRRVAELRDPIVVK
jgi:hypothetical protein